MAKRVTQRGGCVPNAGPLGNKLHDLGKQLDWIRVQFSHHAIVDVNYSWEDPIPDRVPRGAGYAIQKMRAVLDGISVATQLADTTAENPLISRVKHILRNAKTLIFQAYGQAELATKAQHDDDAICTCRDAMSAANERFGADLSALVEMVIGWKLSGHPPESVDIKADTTKKEKKILPLNKMAHACIKLYKQARRSGDKIAMKQVVSDYADEHGGSVTYTLRILSHHPTRWKTQHPTRLKS